MSAKKAFAIIVSIALVCGFIGWLWLHEPSAAITFLDVGQGDAIYIRLADGFDILIDGGPDDHVIERLGKFMPFYDRHIEMIVLTHAHSDHVAGLVEVLERYSIDRIVFPGRIEYESAPYNVFIGKVEEKNISLLAVHAGQRLILPGEAVLEILYPFADTPLVSPDINELSVVAKLTVDGQSFLFTGDAGIDVEEQLIKTGQALDVDVLKVGHHGSRGASSEAFLAATTPMFAVISCGEGNSYGHPHRETLERMKSVGSVIFRTDKAGDVRCKIVHTVVKCTGQKRD